MPFKAKDPGPDLKADGGRARYRRVGEVQKTESPEKQQTLVNPTKVGGLPKEELCCKATGSLVGKKGVPANNSSKSSF